MIRIAALLACFAAPALGQDAAEAAAAELAAAAVQLEAAETATDRIAALTATVRAYESGLSTMRAGQREIALREAEIAASLDDREGELAALLGVLSAIGRTPQAVQQTHPDGPLATLRAGFLVADVTPALEAEVVALRTLLDEAETLRTAQEDAAASLLDGLEGARAARAALGQAITDRTDLPARFEDDPVQTALLVASAQTLGDFAATIAEVRPDGTATLQASGNLPLPVTGITLPDDGSGRDGIRIAAPARALVTAPAPATVLFQGALLDYGTVVILEPATDVMFLLAGLDTVFVAAGQVLPAGTPIGLLGDGSGFDDGILTENLNVLGGETAQALYLEVREGQTPTRPDAWFALEEQ